MVPSLRRAEWCIFFSSSRAVSQPLDYCELSNRFPRDQWNSALQFFLKKQEDWWRCTLSPEWIRRSINTTKESSMWTIFSFHLGSPPLSFFALTLKSATFVKCRVYGASRSALVISSAYLIWFNVNEIDGNEELAQNVLFCTMLWEEKLFHLTRETTDLFLFLKWFPEDVFLKHTVIYILSGQQCLC